jgi:glycosyltransferase involved in cell wall biosynthesis
VIPNGANTEIFHSQAVCSIQVPAPYVIFFGALTRWQGIDTLLSAATTKEWPETVSLVIAGDGTERRSVETAMANNPRIHYVGTVPYHEMPGLIAGSIGAIVPMNRMGERGATGLSPLKLYESLACGVPVVVTDFPGQAEFVREHNCGLVVPPESPLSIAKAVSLLSENVTMRQEMGARGSRAVIQSHSWQCRAVSTNEVLNRFIS